MEYEIWRPEKNKTHQPSLLEMVEKAIKILSRNSKGFFLMVEGRMYFIFLLFLHSIMEGGGTAYIENITQRCEEMNFIF